MQKVKTSKGDRFETFKKSENVAQYRKENREGGHFSLVRLCRLPLKSEKWKGRDPLHEVCIGWTWDLALVVSGVSLKSGPVSVSLKKKGHCYSRAFFLKGKRAD